MARRARVLRDQQADEHPQALRRHLIQVTQRLLAAHGLAGLTTRGIAREAQVSDGVLYNHFADKDDLVVEALTERLASHFAQATAGCPEPGAQDLRAGLTRLVSLGLTLHSDVFPLIGGLLTRPDLMRRVLERLHTGDGAPQLLWQAMARYLAGEQELGSIAPDVQPETVVEVLFGVTNLHAMSHLLAGALLGGGQDVGAHLAGAQDAVTVPAPPQGDVDRLVRFLLRACVPEPVGSRPEPT